MNKIFTIYRSSAGSGKTRTLAREYLKLALDHRSDYFKYILAVTFTNKATQEMKDRILQYLHDFSRGGVNELAEDLKNQLNQDDLTFRNHCHDTLSVLLHNYDQFNISTIDAFFQRVIRSFTRESGLMGDYRLEVDQDLVLEEVIDSLIDELGTHQELTEWVVEFAKDNLENERAWDVRYNLIQFAREIFREEFKAIEKEVMEATSAPGFFRNLKENLWKVRNSFIAKISVPAQEALDMIASRGWQYGDFSFGINSGLKTFLEMCAFERNLKDFKPPGIRVRNHFTIPENWPQKKSPHADDIVRVAREKLAPIISELLEVYDKHFSSALSAEVALRNMYVFGLITDITRKLKEYKDENNVMLLADAPKFLNGVIQDSDTPFIYEKVGSFFRNYLIDEFQDTSGMQWKNFLPLLVNSLDQGYPGFVVGDVKQSIYRWRGGDLKLLQYEVERHVGSDRVEVKELKTNYRSARNIVDFNNNLFPETASEVAALTGHPITAAVYQDVVQHIFAGHEGFVRIKFVTETDDGIKWKARALDAIPEYLEQLQQAGVRLKDIAILVRKNEEGQDIVSHLLQYKNSEKALGHCRYDVISNESLRLDSAASVNLLLGAMKYLANTDDIVARAELAFEFARLHEPARVLTEVFSVTNQFNFENNLPADFSKQKSFLKRLSLIELTETLIEIFRLNDCVGEIAYLQAFQDVILDFMNRERNDLQAFLDWWALNKDKKSIQVSGEVDAVHLLTMHKSKGLQFKYVIIPFCAWGLDHDAWQAPNLWVKSDMFPFDKAGYLPVKYASLLEQTYFDAFYREELGRTYLDNLNLLYVALTRAELGLIVMAPHPGKGNARKTVAQLLHSGIQRSAGLSQGWKIRDEEWCMGELASVSSVSEKPNPSVSLHRYLASGWREKLVIRQTAKSYFEGAKDEAVRKKIGYGIHLHTILSRIEYGDQIDVAIDSIMLEGLVGAEDRDALKKQLDDLLENPKIAHWFDRKWHVRTEVSILLPDGRENRIDRLLTHDKSAIVVDFKTGVPAKDDQRQVMDYMHVLHQMNFIAVEGFLLYVRTGQVVSVTAGKPREVKRKKDRDQLELGL